MKLEKKQDALPEQGVGHAPVQGGGQSGGQGDVHMQGMGPAMPMPAPQKRGSRTLPVLAVLAVLVVGGAAFWLTRDDATRERWRDEAASMVDEVTRDTLLSGVGDLLRSTPPPPPVHVTQPATAPNTLAGQQVQGSVPSPAELTATGTAEGAQTSAAGAEAAASGTVPVGNAAAGATLGATALPQGAHGLMPKVTEDSRIKADIIEDMAAYLVSRYKHRRGGGRLAVSVQGLNSRYGLKMAQQDAGGRAGLLRYAFHPAMLEGLYGLYVDRFMDALQRQATAKAFTPEQTQGLHMALAGRLVTVAGAMESVAAVPDLHKHFQAVEHKAQAVLDINAEVSNGVFELNQLRENKASETEIATKKLRVDGLGARYRRALEERDMAERELARALRQGGAPALDDKTLLYVAQWVDRRIAQGDKDAASVRSAAALLRDLARRCATAGTAKPLGSAPAPAVSALPAQMTGTTPAREPQASPEPAASQTPGTAASVPQAPPALPEAATQNER